MATPRQSSDPLENLAVLIESEYREMPGMRLTFAQATRLWNLSTDDCRHVLEHLVRSGRLAQDDEGRFCRDRDVR